MSCPSSVKKAVNLLPLILCFMPLSLDRRFSRGRTLFRNQGIEKLVGVDFVALQLWQGLPDFSWRLIWIDIKMLMDSNTEMVYDSFQLLCGFAQGKVLRVDGIAEGRPASGA